MNWYIISFLFWHLFRLGVHMAKNGEPLNCNINFFVTALVCGAEISLLALGGLFAIANGWIWVYLAWQFLALTVSLAKHGEHTLLEHFSVGTIFWISVFELAILAFSGMFGLL